MTLGFIGTGALTSAIVTGLRSLEESPLPVLLSPRNRDIAADLASRHSDVRVAADNQAVLDGCDTVMLAVRLRSRATSCPDCGSGATITSSA
ncbi:NAD(P)-binding domain-containing protein [Kaustia mangrovi]|uniref:NAD(P)-binding domain-containing protein n=1 Tax=Kaustia mangrovi TaxID=2593653 RepID=UPI001FE3C592|nr:NAD(P)-binding domain-containing protein [Kaustia mangrovi]